MSVEEPRHLEEQRVRREGQGEGLLDVDAQVAKDPRVHLVGYGPSASTIGANRAGNAAASELMALLGLR